MNRTDAFSMRLFLTTVSIVFLFGCVSPPTAEERELNELMRKSSRTEAEENRLIAHWENKTVEEVAKERELRKQRAAQRQVDRKARQAADRKEIARRSSAEYEVAKLKYDPIDDSRILEIAQQSAAITLKDPDSAKFRNVRIVRRNDRRFVCGEINGKNSFGGYAGYQYFTWGYLSVSIVNPNPQNDLERLYLRTHLRACN